MLHEFGSFTVEQLVTGKWKENCYLLKDQESGEIAIIDPGDDADTIAGRIEASGGKVCHILLTHGHYDHLGAASEICKLTGLSCAIHVADVSLLRRAPVYALAFEKRRIAAPSSITPFQGAEAFYLGGERIQASLAPGHTRGSVCFQFGGCVFTGDTLMKATLGRTDLPGGDDDQIARSVHHLINQLPDNSLILPGHGQPWSQKEAKAWWEESRYVEGLGPEGKT